MKIAKVSLLFIFTVLSTNTFGARAETVIREVTNTNQRKSKDLRFLIGGIMPTHITVRLLNDQDRTHMTIAKPQN